jgi:hypothetical protein
MEPTVTPRLSFGFSALQPQLLPSAPQGWDQYKERQAREESTSVGDYMGSMWRQDGITDGLIAYTVGSQMVPDPNYSPYQGNQWKELSDGVWPEYRNELASAKSAAHAMYLKDLILQKQKDVTRLGDLGLAGNIGRLAFGVVSPENLLMGGLGSVATRARLGMKMATAARGAEGAVAAAAARAGVRAEAAAFAASKTGLASELAGFAASNAAVEKVRQSVNFEDDSTALWEAALIGAAFPLPFELAGAKAAGRLAQRAADEHGYLKAASKLANGEDLSLVELRLVDKVNKASEVVTALERGHITPHAAREQLDGIHGPELPDHLWAERYGDTIRQQGEAILDELFPNRIADRTRKILVKDDLLKLGYDPVSVAAHSDLATKAEVPASSRSVGAPIEVSPSGVAKLPGQELADALARPKGMSKLEIEAAIRSEADKRFPGDQAKASEWATSQRLEHLGHPLEVATPIANAKAAKKLSKALGMADQLKAKETPKAVTEAPTEAAMASPEATPETPKAAPVEAPAAPAADYTSGDNVHWDDRSTGERMYGVVESVREDGFLMVRNEQGRLQPLAPYRVAEPADYKPPEGFGAGSVGAAQVAGSTIAPADKNVAAQRSKLNIGGKTSVPLRWDFFAVLNRSELPEVRELAFKLIKDPLQVDSMVAQPMTASEWKSNLRRTVGGEFHRTAREAAREAAEAMEIPMWGKPAFNREFHSLVTRMTRGDLSIANTNPKIAPMLQRASSAQRKLYGDLLDEMQRAGVHGSHELTPDEFYVNRVWDQRGIREAMEKHGAHNVLQLLANAINVPGLNGDVAKAGKFLDAVQKLEYSKTMQTMHLGARDMGTLRGELQGHGLSQDQIDLVVQAMFEAKESAGTDAGRMGNLKYRFDIGENLSMTTHAGELRIADFFENDARALADQYMNSVAGYVGLAKHEIYSDADWSKTMDGLVNKAVARGLDETANIRYLQDIYSNITGRPMSTQDFSTTARAAAALRSYTRSVSLGQLGLTAAFEMKQAVGLMGFRAFFDQLPAFRSIITALRNGYFPDDTLARDLEHVTGFGSEMSMAYARAQEVDDGFLGQSLNRFEDWSNKASHAADIMSGNASMTSLTRQLSSKMATQRLSDFATGRAELTPKLRERLVGWGVDDDRIGLLLGDLKDYSVTDHKGKLETIDWEAWRDSGSPTYDDFKLVNERMVRDAIQDQDLGETIPFMQTSLGKVFGELKTFFLVAHAKNMLKNTSYMDQTALHVWSVAFIGEALAYASQTSLNYADQPEKLDKMLSPEQIALAAFARSPVSGMLPFFINTGYQVATGGNSLIGSDMTSSGNGRTFVPPSFQAAQRIWAAPSTAMGLLLDNGNVTKQEGQDLFKTLPLSNFYGARNLGNWLTNSLPLKEEQR